MKTLAYVMTLFAFAVPSASAQTPNAAATDLVKLETEWSQAAVKRDALALPRFYADEYVFTDADGSVSNKTKEIANISTGMFRLTAFKFDDMKVAIYGDVAVVTGKNVIKGVWEDIRKDVSGPYRFTDVFVKRNGQWRCVASQASRVIEP